MKTNNVLLMLLAAMTFASCSKQNGEDVISSDNIRIDASIDPLTRVSGNAFENEDQISVYAYEAGKPNSLIVDNVINTYNGTTWTPSAPMTWKDKTARHDFVAIYPNRTVNLASPQKFDLTDDMSKNDILVATATNLQATAGAVRLQFDHIMSKVSVALTFNDEFDTAPAVTKVVLRCQKTVTVNYITKGVVATDILQPMILTLANGNYVGVTAPQTVPVNARMIEVYLGSDPVPYVYTTKEVVTLTQKHSHQFNLKVGGGKKIELLTPVTINDWTPGTPNTGGAVK